ncbi:hypothetical protein [Cobetia marina]|uniref:hypothetical protein n=1 Tax=Cobetia marina TaxID=28258 RepID=UPI003A8E5D75
MKKQSFYPRQVLKKLLRKGTQRLDGGERHALSFFGRLNYPLGPQVTIIEPDIRAGNFEAWMESIRANIKTRIIIQASPPL